MIITKIQGGLGNQLFQYALGRNLTIKNNVELKLDRTDYDKKDRYREYGLDNFNINSRIASVEEINRFYNDWEKIKNKFTTPYKRSVVVNLGYEFNKNILKLTDNVYLYGYWPSEKYFIEIRDILKNEFTLKKDLSKDSQNLTKELTEKNSISIHIRRADYLKNEKFSKIFTVLDLDYYRQSIKLIATKINNPIFYIFSDDIEWAKSNLVIPYPVFFSSTPNIPDYEELIIMSKCKHNIIANSSFSWWAAWLNDNPKKTIIAPKQWLKDPEINTKDLIPSSWIRI